MAAPGAIVPSCESDAVPSNMEESRLLLLPTPVIDLLVRKIKDSSLHSLLNLRLICKTTRSWVDDYPEAKGEELMANARVLMSLDIESVEKFNLTAPQLPITSLSLDTSSLLITVEHSEELEAMWESFFEYWDSRLQSLEIQKEGFGELFSNKDATRIRYCIRRLMGSPGFKKITFLRDFDWDLVNPFPQSLFKINDFIIDRSNPIDLLSFIQNESLIQKFFCNLGSNQNLRNVALKFSSNANLVSFKNFIEAQKYNQQLKLTLTMAKSFNFNEFTVAVFIDLIKTAVACECQIRFHLDMSCDVTMNSFFRAAKQELSALEYFKFTNVQIQTLVVACPLDDPTVLDLQILEGLKDLSLTRMTPENSANFRFPPNLTAAGCGKGFPAAANLPLNITKLELSHISCGFDELERSMAELGNHCVNLEKLIIFYCCEEVSGSPKELCGDEGTDEGMTRFKKLKSLTIKTYIHSGPEQDAIARELLLNRLKIDQIPLEHLVISTHSLLMPEVENYDQMGLPRTPFYMWNYQQLVQAFQNTRRGASLGRPSLSSNYLPSLDEIILSRLCDGPLSKTLIFVEMVKLSVSPNSLSVLERLKAIVKSNCQSRIQKEGRGSWLHQYPQNNVFYWTA